MYTHNLTYVTPIEVYMQKKVSRTTTVSGMISTSFCSVVTTPVVHVVRTSFHLFAKEQRKVKSKSCYLKKKIKDYRKEEWVICYLSCSAIAMTTALFFSFTAASRMLSFVLFNVTSECALESSNVTTGA